MSSLPKQRWTEAEYLAFERASKEKHELIDGEIVSMTGASEPHNRIVTNVSVSLYNQIGDRPCSVYTSDMRVRISRRQYTYPDITVVCGASVLAEDDYQDVLLNPTVIIEVLSPSTQGYDRGDKFTLYRTLPSLQEYVLISQHRIQIERYTRQPDNLWLFADTQQADGFLNLTSIACTLSAKDVYRRIQFENDLSDFGATDS
jgi:Uma2 family endonuclease